MVKYYLITMLALQAIALCSTSETPTRESVKKLARVMSLGLFVWGLWLLLTIIGIG